MIKYLIALLLVSFSLTAETITTGNLLPNSGDGVDWNSSTTDQINSANSSGYVTNGSTINGFDITCTNQSNCGYKYSVGGDFEVTGTATVRVDDIALTNNSINQSMLDNGITLNSYVDVANCESTEGNCESKGGNNDSHTTTVKLKNSSGTLLSTSTQTRTEVTGFKGNCNGYPGSSASGVTAGCGQYNDRIIYLGVGSNKVDWSWSGTDSNYSNQSRQGPNLLGASLKMTYNNTEFSPIDDDTQESIEDIDEDIVDIIEDIPEDFNWYNDDLTIYEIPIEEEIVFEDNFIFDDTFYFEDIDMEELPTMEEFDMEVFEEIPNMEMVFFEEEFSEPVMVTEEIFTEEFEEDFTEFLEETGMEEEFMEFLEEEGITAEEFFEEITEEEFNDELTEESFEEFEEPVEEIATNEESVPEVVEDKEEAVEEPTKTESIEEEKEVASNEQSETKSEEEKSDSEGTEESEVSTEDGGEQEDIQSEEKGNADTDTNISTTVAKVESKLKQNLKKVAKEIAKVTKINTQNLSKEDIFFKSNTLDAYNKTQFYKSKDIYTDQNLDLFNQIDLGVYNKDIYTTVTLASYVNNDPVEKHNKKMQEIKIKKQQLLVELEALKQ